MVALDVGDRAIELALKTAPVRNIQQEIDIRQTLQFINSRQCLRQLDLEPANREFGPVGGDRQPGRRRGSGFHPSGALWRRFGLHHAAFTAFRGRWSGRLGFLLHRHPLRRLAGIHQDRIVHSGPLATPCRSLGRSYNPAYVFGFPERIDRMTAPVAIIMGRQSDWETMRHAAAPLTALGVTSEKHIVSAHRTPDRLFAFSKGAKAAGYKIIIAGAGGAAHLARIAASLTVLP